MSVRSSLSSIPSVVPPDLLIFFRIPKTAGNTVDGLFEHNMPGEFFHAHCGPTDSALLTRSTAQIAEKYHHLTVDQQQRIRCVIGIHLALDVDTLFARPSKFFTVVRHPVDRVISNFFHNRVEAHLPSYRFLRTMTLEQYLESGIGLDAHNLQVRLLSGCPELDAPWGAKGRPISAPPVERRHLELAKRNIEERFLVAAPLERLDALVWYFKRLYGWPTQRCFYLVRNETASRPALSAVSESTRQRLADWNRFDIELYEWVKERFALQIAPMQPGFDEQVRRFATMNRLVRRLAEASPANVRRIANHVLFRQRPDLFAGVDTAAA
jgi:hypothetical protein